MVKFQINDTHYETPGSWHKVTFDKFLDSIAKLDPKRPMALVRFLEEHNEALGKWLVHFLKRKGVETISELSNECSEELDQKVNKMFNDRWEKIPPKEKDKCHRFFSITVAFWCNVKSELIREAMNLDDLVATFWTIEYELNPENATIDENWTGFESDGVEYLPPTKHMEASTVLEFADSAQFQEDMAELEKGNWLAMKDVMVVLCRPKGEVYNYERGKHEKRKRDFGKITMNHVINTAFFLLRLNDTLKDNILIYTLMQEKQRLQQNSTQSAMGGSM